MFSLKVPTPAPLQNVSPEAFLRMKGYMQVVLSAVIASSGAIVFLRNPTNQITLISLAVICAFLLWRVRKGDLNLAAYIMPMLAIVIATVFSINGAGPRDVSVFALFIALALSALFLGNRALNVFTVLAFASFVFINAVYDVPEYKARAVDVVYFFIYLNVSNLLIRSIVHNLNASLQQVRASEQALEKLNRELEQRVAERTQQLESAMNQQVELNERLLESDRVKSQFLASMSHELRTPLNAILNFTEFVALGVLGDINDKQKDALDKSLSSGHHLLSLINDVLDITKIEAGMLKLFVEENVQLETLLSEAMATAQTLVNGKPIAIQTIIEPDLPTLLADRRRIKQVLLNLISNACKFTEKGSITLYAKQQGAGVLISVQDTGTGIAPEDHDLIFEPFQQTEQGVQHAHGTGLGLPISKRLVEAHQGKLWLESTVGVGSVFHIYLPARAYELVQMIPEDGIQYA